MLGLDHHADAKRVEHVLDRLGDVEGQLFLDLQAARKALDDAGEFRNADDAIARQIADMGGADHRQHVMLAEADDADVGEHDQFVVAAGLLERAFEILARVLVIAGEKLRVGAGDARRRVLQALALGIVAGPFDQHAHGRFRVALRDPALRLALIVHAASRRPPRAILR